MSSSLNKFSPYVLAFVRIIAGYMFLLHGTAKFWEFPISMTGGQGGVELFSQLGVGGVLEIVGGLLLILGWFTRPAAFLLAGEMAVAYFGMHASASDVLLPIANHGELAALYSVLFLYFFFAGAGAFALDNKFRKGQ
ncbi:putative oxidoreductase [Mesocricetibacter intestinalis]|uniref:Putative oxidoreductase n=1 Tax=Mesocricetibacter intestinalis TaxID=1521930 RepID=A0A4R6VG30_9PAST|nr:DoxX family protein [Mesocricetibacter intestinalis]TDQ59832.1 putative oxidoreductase [Mesocricetibacter intestinalis]